MTKTEDDRDDRDRALRDWVELQRKVLPIATAIEQVQARWQAASDVDKAVLEPKLYALLMEAGRRDEALQLFGSAIAQRPNEVLSPTGWPFCDDEVSGEQLKLIDFALTHACSSGAWVRRILGLKAWMLLLLRRGDELGQVLEQIMAHEVRRNVPDVGRERYFVDASPPGLIFPDVRARYDDFCPKRAFDVPFPSAEFESPVWDPSGDEIPAVHPRTDTIDRTDSSGPDDRMPGTKTTVSVDEIDRIIFTRLRAHGNWRKTVAVIGWVLQQCEEQQRPIAGYEIFERILQLVTDGALEARGNLSVWGYSEIRLVHDKAAS